MSKYKYRLQRECPLRSRCEGCKYGKSVGYYSVMCSYSETTKEKAMPKSKNWNAEFLRWGHMGVKLSNDAGLKTDSPQEALEYLSPIFLSLTSSIPMKSSIHSCVVKNVNGFLSYITRPATHNVLSLSCSTFNLKTTPSW